jgi:glycosyltransferase involved in cell wall biosynthesis
MNILYLTMAPIDEASGVYKKIRAQADAYRRLGHTCKLLFVRDTEDAYYYSGDGMERLTMTSRNHIKYILDYLLTCDFCYVRFELLRHKNYKRIIGLCRKNDIPIVTEIPTYPPYQESLARVKEFLHNKKILKALKTFLGTAFVILDLYRTTMYSKLMIMVADNKKFCFADTIRIENGVDIARNPYQEKPSNEGRLRIIAVSNFSVWNGYDRAIMGMKQYIDNHQNPKIELIMVGGLEEGYSLIKQTKELGLTEYVKFTGALSGKELDEAYANADIALASLGNHRRKVFANSSLKAKEYSSRGMLMVLSDAEGIEKEIKERSFIVRSDESPIDFEAIEIWYHEMHNKQETRKYIHEFAVQNYSWDVQIEKIIKNANNGHDLRKS